VKVALASIAFDAGTQIREAINEAVVAEYAERMTKGVIFPAVVLFHDGNQYYMADGFHRALAAKRNDFSDIEADVQPGTKTDALWFALGANKANGQRLTLADKKHAVLLALQTWPAKSAGQIGDQVGCSHSYVSSIRNEVSMTGNPEHVTGKDGSTYPASKSARERRRETVASLLVQGQSVSEVRAATGVGRDVISEVRRDLGLSGVPTTKAARAQRLDRMREMAAEGYSSRQIAADVELSDDRCRELLRRQGIEVPADAVIGKTKRHDSTRIIARIVADAENVTEGVTLIDFTDVDRSQLPAWLKSLQESRDKLGAFIRRLMKEQQNGQAA